MQMVRKDDDRIGTKWMPLAYRSVSIAKSIDVFDQQTR